MLHNSIFVILSAAKALLLFPLIFFVILREAKDLLFAVIGQTLSAAFSKP